MDEQQEIAAVIAELLELIDGWEYTAALDYKLRKRAEAVIAAANQADAKTQNLRRHLADCQQQVSDWQAEAARQEARAQAAEAEVERLRAEALDYWHPPE